MLRIALRALRSRRTQSITLVILAMLVTGAAVAAPFYVYASTERLIVNDLRQVPTAKRQVTVSRNLSVAGFDVSGLQDDIDEQPNQLKLPGFTSVLSVRVVGNLEPDTAPTVAALSERQDVCAHVVITGSCPAGTGEGIVSTATAQLFGLKVGSTVPFKADSMDKPLRIAVVGVYVPDDANDAYWGQSSLALQAGQHSTGGALTDAVFVTLPTIVATGANGATIDDDEIMPIKAISVPQAVTIGRAVYKAQVNLPSRGYPTVSQIPQLANQLVTDTNAIFIGVPLGAAQLVLFGWFALFLCIRATAVARRFDVGILKLRGLPSRSLWTLMTEQSAVPILIGAPIGAVAGFLGARLLAGRVIASSDIKLAAVFAAAAAALAIAGGLLAALVAERRALATPVGDLLRTTPPRRRGWRADVVDLVIVALAIVGVVQIRNTHGPAGSGLSVLAPGLIALAASLLLARFLIPLAARAVTFTRRTGRVRGLLVSTYLARRPGLDRVFALVSIAVALLTYSILAWSTSAQARTDRAELEIGAPTVLTVGTVAPNQLLADVRRADPSGRYAMAVTEMAGFTGHPGVLAVDSSRLAAVLPSSPGMAISGSRLAALLHPTDTRPISITGTSVQLAVDAAALPSAQIYVVVELNENSGPTTLLLGPLQAGAHVYSAATPTCTGTPSCTLTGFELLSGSVKDRPVPADVAPVGTVVTLRELHQQAPVGTVVDTANFGRLAAWRPSFEATQYQPLLTQSAQGLTMTMPARTYNPALTMDPTAYAYAQSVPIPAVIAGPLAQPPYPGVPAVAPFGVMSVPVRIAGSVGDVPRIGQGIVVDLDYAQALSSLDSHAEAYEVWLSAGAPADMTAKLRRAGLVVVGSETVAGRTDRYAQQAGVVGLRFALLGGLIGLALAAVAFLVVTSVERDPRARELVALRHQGVNTRSAAVVARRGYIWLAGGGLVAGLAGGLLDRYLTGSPPSLFGDGWTTLAQPSMFGGRSLLVVVALATVTLGVAAGLGAWQLNRSIRIRTEAGSR